MSTNGQAKVLTHDEIARLFAVMDSLRDQALFGILLYCGLRVSEAISLRPSDIKGLVLVLPAKATKGKLATRQIDIHPRLAALLAAYDNGEAEYLFPGCHGRGKLARSSADWLLDQVLTYVGLEELGISTHDSRRTALTNLSNAGVSLRVIQEISGHRSLASLQRVSRGEPGAEE
ncbi:MULTISPECIES: site-specific integrase [Cyanophyceae]|uniref:tyrosine-type recombinase/integrase n=1 Tax=Cyanophyceae TaxID=3028117 RepID=UPI0018F01DCE|nr:MULTISPECIES: site-specific integrase [Cyanophyceae]